MSRNTVGFDWGGLGKNIFGGVHIAGKVVATAFGGKALADQAEKLESPILPDWAKSKPAPAPDASAATTAPTDASAAASAPASAPSAPAAPSAGPAASAPSGPPTFVVNAPDFVAMVMPGAKPKDMPKPIIKPLSVAVIGGTRFDGNGYTPGEGFGKHFSFGYSNPARVDIVVGKQTIISFPNIKQIVFGVSDSHAAATVSGFGLDDIETLLRSVIMPQRNPGYASGRNPYHHGSSSRWGAKPTVSAPSGKPTVTVPGLSARDQSASRLSPLEQQDLGLPSDAPRPGGRKPPNVLGWQDRDDYTEIVGHQDRDDYTEIVGELLGLTGSISMPPLDETVEIEPNMYLHGTACLGAAPPKPGKPARVGIVVKSAPITGRQFTAVAVAPSKKLDHATAISNAKMVAQRAITVGQQIQKAAAQLAQQKPASVHGFSDIEFELLGLTGAAPVSPAQLKKLGAALVQAGKDQQKRADTHQKLIAGNQQKLQSGVARVQSTTNKGLGGQPHAIHGDSGRSHVGADFGMPYDLLGEDFDMPFDLLGDDGSGLPTGTGDTMSATGVPGPPNYGIGAPPDTTSTALQPGVDFQPDPNPNGQDQAFYHGLPQGAVVFDGSRQFGFDDVGSYVAFFGPLNGAPSDVNNGIWPENSWVPSFAAGAVFQGGFRWHPDGWWYNWTGDTQRGSEGGDKKLMGAGPHNWGPLIGNPKSQFKGLRYDIDGDQWFWFYDQAPPWATQVTRDGTLAKAILDYNTNVTAAKQNYAAAVAQDALTAQQAAQAAQQQAQQDAQQQSAEQAAQSAANVAQTQAQGQMSSLDVQQRQAQIQAYQANLQAMSQGGGGGYGGGGYGGGGAYDASDTADDGGGGGFDDGSGGGDDGSNSVDAGIDWGDDSSAGGF